MNEETYFTAKQAVEEGFADGILFDEEAPKVASVGGALIPQAVIDKTRRIIKEREVKSAITDEQLQYIIDEVTNNLKQKEKQKEPEKPEQNGIQRFFLNL